MLTQKRLKEVLDYDPETGIFVWRSKKSRNKGKVAGHLRSDGYVAIMVDSKLYRAHRLAWLYVHGYFPEHDIDHMNGVRDDNRLVNLREASRACNLQNKMISSRNTSGFPGVVRHRDRERWVAQVKLTQKAVFLGLHQTALDAALARYTWEVNCENWTCNHRSKLVLAIKKSWPEFNEKSLGGNK